MKREDIENASLAKLNDLIDIHLMPNQPYSGVYPDWSGDISAAWKVQEKLQENGGMVLGCYGSKRGSRWYTVQTIVGAKEISVTCHAAPEAICKAALLAVLEVTP